MANTIGAVTTAPPMPAAGSSDDMVGAMAAYQKQARETMAFTLMQGETNKQQGITTGLANMLEANGQAAKNRGEAAKQQV